MGRKTLATGVLSLLGLACWAAPRERAGLWLDVPFVHQQKDGCGAAALAMLLQYWSTKDAAVPAERSDSARIQRELYSPEARGIYASAMERYLRESGFEVFAFRGEWNDLEHHLRMGRPLLVSVLPSPRAARHYLVIAGIDWQRDGVLVNDPARGKLRRVEHAAFEKEWQAADHWTLLALPQHRE